MHPKVHNVIIYGYFFVGPSPGWLFSWPSQEEEGRRATRASQYQKCRGFYYFYFYQMLN